MSTVSQVKKLKITVTNIKSVLMKRTKRLANLKKINDRDTRNLFSSQKRGAAEKKLESPLKKEGSGITGVASKTGSVLGLGKMFDVLKLLGLGVGVNAVFENLDKITEGAENLKKKVDSWFGNNKGKMDDVEKGLDKLDTNELKKMTDKFFNQSKKLGEEFEKLKDPSTTYSYPDPDNSNKEITISAKKFWDDQIKKEEDRTGKTFPRIKERDFSKVEPIKKDANLNGLLNSSGSSGNIAYLLRQNIIYEA
tara:strand:- start:284 stop:1036 length:753 start_codon:yes stop_codon:yes gene_type:complete